MSTIVIPDDYQDAVRTLNCFSMLSKLEVIVYNDTVKDLESLTERFREADALVLIRERTAITQVLLERLPKLRFISQTGKGYPHIDIAACTRRGVAVAVGGGSPYAPAELTWALILAAMRRIPQEVQNMKAGRWQRAFGVSVRGRTLGIFSYGKIGKLVAEIGRAFGMRILVHGREHSLVSAQQDGFEVTSSREALFERSDILSLHTKLTPETRGMIRAEDLARMKPSALLVNTSRAELIESGALVDALQQGHPGYAAVDVYESEPVPDHPLLHLDNVICTPHLGYVEKDSYETYFSAAFENLLSFLSGTPQNVVNPEALGTHDNS